MARILTTINVDTDKITKNIEAKVGDTVKLVRELKAEDIDNDTPPWSWGIGSGMPSPVKLINDSPLEFICIAKGGAVAWCDYDGERTQYTVDII